MEFFRDLLSNYVLVCAMLSWVAAQLLKTIIYLVLHKNFSLERVLGAGGWPSSHTAAVVGAAVAVGRVSGVGSPLFGVAVVLAGVVIYDALGIRRQAGFHARMLNVLVKHHPEETTRYVPKKKTEFKELLGHSPFEVLSGAALAVIICFLIPK